MARIFMLRGVADSGTDARTQPTQSIVTASKPISNAAVRKTDLFRSHVLRKVALKEVHHVRADL